MFYRSHVRRAVGIPIFGRIFVRLCELLTKKKGNPGDMRKIHVTRQFSRLATLRVTFSRLGALRVTFSKKIIFLVK